MSDRPTCEELEQRVKELEQLARKGEEVEVRLHKLQDYLDGIMTGMYETLVVINRDFVIQDVNRGFLEAYGGEGGSGALSGV